MQTAIIIGATSGIGRELAVRLAEAGWTARVIKVIETSSR